MKTIEEYTKVLLEEPFAALVSQLDIYDEKLEALQANRPEVLVDFKKYRESLSDIITGVESKNFTFSVDNLQTLIFDDVNQEQDGSLAESLAEYEDLDNQVQALIDSIQADNIAYNNSIRAANTNDNAVFMQLEEKRKYLESYSNKVIDLCAQYGVTTSDVDIDTNTFNPNELNTLYDKYIKYIEKEATGNNVITQFRNKVPNIWTQGVIMGILFILAFSPIMSLVSISFIGLLAYTQISNVNRGKYYSVLLAIIFNIKPEDMGYVNIDESLLLPEVLTDEFMDSDERFLAFSEMYDALDEKDTERKNSLEGTSVVSQFSIKKTSIELRIVEMGKIYRECVARLVDRLQAEQKFIDQQYERIKENFKPFGQRFTQHLYASHKYTLGLKDEFIEETVDTGGANVIIRPIEDATKFAKFIQALVVNIFCNVMPGKAKVLIYDPNGFGQAVLPLYDESISTYLDIKNDNLNEILEQYSAIAQANLKRMKGSTIGEYNKMCEESGITPIEYTHIFLLSQPKTIEEDEKLNSFFEYSNTTGVFLWVVSDVLSSKSAYVFKNTFSDVNNPIIDTITDAWCSTTSTAISEAIAGAKPKGLLWNDFIENVLPDDKMWKANADDFMNLYAGYLDGDPNKYKPYEIGNTGNVHVIGVGGTGAGKSVLLNHLIATATQEYSPAELELWLGDFKGTEFKFYIPNPSFNYALPHIKACMCTSDGDYATSVFKALRDEADLRYEIMKTPNEFPDEIKYNPNNVVIPNQKGAVGWNRYWRKMADETGDNKFLQNCFKRILFICDEFQVIFEKADPKNVELIKADITQIAKVGRAANVHIFFASQSMKKTLSADILQQFSLRFALRCDKEVSMEILNSTAASDIREKFGYLVMSATGITKDAQPRYKTPFIPDDALRAHIKKLQLRAESEGYPKQDVITYEEITKHDLSELDDLYSDPALQDKLPDYGTFFLGQRMKYDPNKAPDNIVLNKDNNTNILASFPETTDYVYFFNTIMKNIDCSKVQATTIINSALPDLAYLCHAEEHITRTDHEFLLGKENSPRDVIAWLDKLISHREQSGNTDTPVYIILMGWDKAVGFGVDADVSVRNKLNVMLQTAGVLNIHFIMLFTGLTGIQASTIGACMYNIIGKSSDDDSFSILNNKQASANYTMRTGWMFSKHHGEINRNKLYISPIDREIASKTIVIN